MLLDNDRIICVSDGRMTPEHFRNNIRIHHPDGAGEPLDWYEGSQTQAKTGEHFLDPGKFEALMQEQFRGRKNIHAALLQNSWGGVMASQLVCGDITCAAHNSEGSVSAYGTSIAGSVAAESLFWFGNIHLLEDTRYMLHIAELAEEQRQEVIAMLGPEKAERYFEHKNRVRHRLHETNIRELIRRAHEKYRNQVRERARDALMRHGIRHELVFTGKELAHFGIVKSAFPDVATLEEKFAEEQSVKTDKGSWQENPIHRFFLFSKIEERIRRELGILVKILLRDNELQTVQMPTVPGDAVRKHMPQVVRIIHDALPDLRMAQRVAPAS